MLKTHCKNGHPFDEENTRICPDGRRKCRACQRGFSKASELKARRARGVLPVVPLRDTEWREGSEYVLRDNGYATPCWIWQRQIDAKGYGTVFFAYARRVVAHRISYERAFGSVASGLELHHECETPACINPAHLTALTPREHLARHGRLVLGMENARQIRTRLEAGESANALAREFGVTRGSIQHIKTGASYAER